MRRRKIFKINILFFIVFIFLFSNSVSGFFNYKSSNNIPFLNNSKDQEGNIGHLGRTLIYVNSTPSLHVKYLLNEHIFLNWTNDGVYVTGYLSVTESYLKEPRKGWIDFPALIESGPYLFYRIMPNELLPVWPYQNFELLPSGINITDTKIFQIKVPLMMLPPDTTDFVLEGTYSVRAYVGFKVLWSPQSKPFFVHITLI